MARRTSDRLESADFAFERGRIMRRGDTVFRIAEERGALLVLEHATTLERKVLQRETLMIEYARGMVVPASEADALRAASGVTAVEIADEPLKGIPLDMLSYSQQRHLRATLRYIDELRALGYGCLRPTALLKMDFERIKRGLLVSDPDLMLLSPETVYKWSRVYDEAGGDARSLIPRFADRGGRGHGRLSNEVDTAIRETLEELRKDDKAKIRAVTIESGVRKRLTSRIGPEQAGRCMPGRSTVSRRMKAEFSEYEITLRNKGAAVANKAFRTWYPRDRAQWPLEVVEFDDKDSRVFLIDERTGLPYGRGFVTPGVDQYSLVPLGFSISEMPRSTWSAICALTNAILPKDPDAPEYGLLTTIPEFSGKPGIALFDNATYNHVKEIDLAGREIGLTPAWAKPRTPTEKSAVENFNGRMDACFFSELPGYAGHKADKAGLERGTETANMSKDEFERRLLKWAYDDYCNDPGVDGLTPRQRWHAVMRLTTPRYPLDINRLRIVPMLRDTVSLRPEGIQFTGLIYQNDYLKKLRKTIGAKAKIEFRYDPRDMFFVYVFDPLARRLFLVESANPEYTRGLRLYQHRLIRKMARQRGRANPSVPQLLEAREELRTLVSQARVSKRKRERQRAYHTGELPGQKTNEPIKVVMTDLETQIADIDDVEMEAGDEGWELPVDI